MANMNARHDASYKHLFSSPKVVRHLVEGFLPEERGRRPSGSSASSARGIWPEWVQARLRMANADEIDTWLDRVLDAQRLEEVFAENLSDLGKR